METKRRFSRLRLAYVALFVVFYLAWMTAELCDDTNWIVAVAGTVTTGVILLPATMALILTAMRRRWTDTSICGTLLVLFLLVSHQFKILPRPRETTPNQIRVMSFNVDHGWYGPDRIAKLVKASKIDAFAFQECGAVGDKEALAELKELLPEFNFVSDAGRTSATRLSVVSQRVISLDGLANSWSMIEQIVQYREETVRILNVHAPSYLPEETFARPVSEWFSKWSELSKSQIRLLKEELNQIERDPSPTVLCGDFNMTPSSSRYRLMAKLGRDCFAEVGSGFGWTTPSGFPMRRIDYIWAFHGVRPVFTWVADWHASDHAAVIADLAIP